MTLHYSINQAGLLSNGSEIQGPGLYWIAIETSKDAFSFCQEVLKALPAEAKAALISEAAPENLCEHLPKIALDVLPLFQLKTKTALLYLKQDLIRVIDTRERLFILVISDQLWENITAEALEQWLKDLYQWSLQEDNLLLILCYGSHFKKLPLSLLNQYHFLNGLSQLCQDHHQLKYHIFWWGTQNNLITHQTMSLMHHNHIWSAQGDNVSSLIHAYTLDDQMILAEQQVLEGAPPLSKDWQLFASNKQLAQAAEILRAATVIFVIEHSNQVEALARKIHHLRQHCGKLLKIVVREMMKTLRFSDEQLLSICGVNLIVPQAISLPKFLIMLDNIKGQSFHKSVPENIEKILAEIRPINKIGVLPAEDFKSTVLNRIHSTLLPKNGKGVLIILTPKADLLSRQAATLFHLNRQGDIMTISDNKLYLFLSTCYMNDAERVLTSLLQTPIHQIFAFYQIWDKDLLIMEQIHHIDSKASEPIIAREGAFRSPVKEKNMHEIPIEITLA